MENKYFTPSIEDIRVGYECEYNKSDFTTCDDWNKITIEFQDFYNGVIADFSPEANLKNIRTQYLTKEQIEAEGCELVVYTLATSNEKLRTFTYKKELKTPIEFFEGYNIIYIHHYPTTNKLTIELHKDDSFSNGKKLFYGECKDINTFRQITKLVGI